MNRSHVCVEGFNKDIYVKKLWFPDNEGIKDAWLRRDVKTGHSLREVPAVKGKHRNVIVISCKCIRMDGVSGSVHDSFGFSFLDLGCSHLHCESDSTDGAQVFGLGFQVKGMPERAASFCFCNRVVFNRYDPICNTGRTLR